MLFTLSQAAKEARISKSTLSKALARGRMTALRREDGSFQIEASELFRVFPRKPEELGDTGEQDEQPERVQQPRGAEAGVLRERLNAAQDRLNDAQDRLRQEREERERERATWERERETILERERTNAEDLRRRLDKAEEHIRLLKAPEPAERAQEAPAVPAEKPQDPPAVVEDLRKRLEETEAWIAALTAPERPQVGRDGATRGAEPLKAPRTLWARLLGRG